MLAVICLLFLLGLGHCQDNDLPSKIDVEGSINRTIEEVERQVRANPSLPQLTRPEIVNILRNITSQDLNEYKDEGKLERAKNLYQRALMVVLPYNAEDSSGNVKDLYTKPPIVQMIPDNFKPENGKENEEAQSEKNIVQNTEVLTTENLVASRAPYKTALKESTTLRNRYKNHKDTYSDVRTKVSLKETLKLDSSPVKFSFNLENLQKNAYTTEKATTARYPVYRGNGSSNSDLEVIYSTSITDELTTKPAPKDNAVYLETPKGNQNVLSSSQWRYNAPPTAVTMKPTAPSTVDKIPFLPTINVQPEDGPAIPIAQKLHIPTEGTKVETTFVTSTENPTTFYVTPMPTDRTSKVKYSSTYSVNSAGFRQSTSSATSTSTAMPMRPEVMDLLASIGLKPDNSTNVEDVYKNSKDILKSKVQIPGSSSIYSTVSGLVPVGSDTVSIVNQNTFENSGSEIKKAVENLSPDVQLLFQRFGLQTSFLDQPTTTTTQRTTANLNSYTNFKPLPTSNVKDEEFREFLAKFGLGGGSNRSEKSLKQTTEAPSIIDAVPDNMVGILQNIGLISNSQKRVEKVPETVEDMESTETSKFHVFKPHEVTVKNPEQRNKINELLDTVKLIQEGKADIQNARKVASELLQTTKFLKDGPDPLKLDEIIKTYNEDIRNEVKRQQEQQEEPTSASSVEGTASPSVATTELTETTMSTPTATDAEKADSDQSSMITTAAPEDSSTTTTTAVSTMTTSNAMALEESFGGTTRAPDPALPPKRKSGLYFLVDWNTFLEVGEDDKEKVNLRFQPKVGDRSRFLPVTVP